MRIAHTLAGAMLLVAPCFVQLASAQTFPSKPITIIGTNPGGGADLQARIVAVGLTASLGQPAFVVNRPGSQVIPATAVQKAAPDGYTLMSLGGNLFWLGPFLDDMPYDPVKDFAPVTLTTISPNMIVANPSVAANNVRELIALAKAKPGVLNFGSGNPGGSPHLAGELFKAMSQTNIVVVQYKGTAPAMAAVMSGQIQLLFPTVSTGLTESKAGRVKALAVTSLKPSALAPGLATVSDSGLPGYESSAAYVVFAPAKTPPPIIDRLNTTIVEYLRRPDVRDKLLGLGMEVVASTPQELTAYMKADMDRMGKIIKENGIRAE